MNETLLYTGVACILAAIVGGGFKGLGIEVPLVATLRRQALLAVSGLALVGFAQPQSFWAQFRTDARSELGAGLEKYDQGMYGDALGHFRKAATAGDPEAQYHYGEMLFHGEGVAPDEKQGMDWVRRSADNGFPLAQSLIADSLIKSNQIAEGRSWAKRSADQGDPVGFLLLARTEKKGDPLIMRHLQVAAEKGLAQAQFQLAEAMLIQAYNTKDDTRVADYSIWLGRAAAQMHPGALCYVAVTRNSVLERTPPEKMREIQQQRETLLLSVLLCLRNWSQQGESSTEDMEAIENIRKRVEKELPVPVRFSVRERAEKARPKLEGRIRHGHFDWRSK